MISFPEIASWSTKCLCSQYLSVHVAEALARVLDADRTSRDQTVTWAVGVLSDGDWEVLGAWPGVAVDRAFWRGIWDDLDSRGVDRISLVCASDPNARTLCAGVEVLPPFRPTPGEGHAPAASSLGVLRAEARRAVREASGVRAARLALERLLSGSGTGRAAVLALDWPAVLDGLRPFYALRPHRRALVRAGDEYLEQLGHGLRRAVARHGPFADLAAAVSFVSQTLFRDELRLKFSKLSGLAWPRLRVVGADAAGLASLGH